MQPDISAQLEKININAQQALSTTTSLQEIAAILQQATNEINIISNNHKDTENTCVRTAIAIARRDLHKLGEQAEINAETTEVLPQLNDINNGLLNLLSTSTKEAFLTALKGSLPLIEEIAQRYLENKVVQTRIKQMREQLAREKTRVEKCLTN